MRRLILIPSLLLVLWFTACEPAKKTNEHVHDSKASEQTALDTIRKSIPKDTHAQIGVAHLAIKYHAPAVRGRTIWGGLVPYDEVWVTGAHQATSIETSATLTISDKEIPAGKYAFFTIPGKETWTVILNKNWEQHLADEYDQKDDVLRIELQPQQLPDTQERLTYSITRNNEESGSVDFMWEKIKLSVPFQIK